MRSSFTCRRWYFYCSCYIGSENRRIAAGPEIQSRGFVYVRESEELMKEAEDKVREIVETVFKRNVLSGLTSNRICEIKSVNYYLKYKTSSNDYSSYFRNLRYIQSKRGRTTSQLCNNLKGYVNSLLKLFTLVYDDKSKCGWYCSNLFHTLKILLIHIGIL